MMTISFKGAHFPKEVILMGVRWYLAYPLSTRHVEERMEERGVELDHATINRWVIKYNPLRQKLSRSDLVQLAEVGKKVLKGMAWHRYAVDPRFVQCGGVKKTRNASSSEGHDF